eukprot:jgi/Chlat1/598/Chrsp103S01030
MAMSGSLAGLQLRVVPEAVVVQQEGRCARPAHASAGQAEDLKEKVSHTPPAFREPGHVAEWAPDSWQQRTAMQQPDYRDQEAVATALQTLRKYPPLVFAGEARKLQEGIAQAAAGKAFILQGGDCAESFAEFCADNIRDSFRVLLQMSVVLMFGGSVPVVKIGRMAGQFAKPRSEPMETVDGVALPSYRGDIINGDAFVPEARNPDPFRLSAATLNLIRGFASGGYAAMQRVTKWNLDFMQGSSQAARYMELATRIDDCMGFMAACGLTPSDPVMRSTEFYTSHEALLLQYEQALTREDSTTGLWYDCSAHMVWCGERTRQMDGAHLEFMRGIANPIGIKISDKIDPSELVELCSVLNPNNTPGRLTVIVRMGADKLEGTIPGGVHLEMTGQDVTECLGGGIDIKEEDLHSRYHTHCDPRLNASQALELAFLISDRLRARRGKGLSCKIDA